VANWKINCMENDYPGLWHSWFREQIVAVGWPPPKYGLHAPHAAHDWSLARRYLRQMSEGDKVIVQLKNWRVGRIGMVLGKQIEDAEWNPSVPKQGGDSGEMGRRVIVRWDMKRGRLTPDYVVELPPDARPNPRIWRLTLSQVPDVAFAKMERAFHDERNWVSLVPGFASERALSEYISASPHLLEDGLVPYPSAAAREMVFPDRTRLDVLLLDPKQNIVIVECKQGAPTLQNIQQLRGYMRNAEKLRMGLKVGRNIRGILVHGGARKLSAEVRKESKMAPRVELVQFSVAVGFTPSL
jgi:hypothetical protein